MVSVTDTKVFNQPQTVAETWYWAFKSHELKAGQVKPLNFLGRELAVYRGEDGVVRAVDAFCPHMGAHLAEGKVDGKGLRCFFHAWKFDENGELADIPCRDKPGLQARIQQHPVSEKYGVIWIYTGETPDHEVHFVPELAGVEVDHAFGNHFVKGCHPSVLLVNAIDAHHFNSVHNFPVDVKFECLPLNDHTIQFNNTTTIPQSRWFLRLFSRFYADRLTYSLCYTAGTTGSVTVGPDFLHCHIIFALRPTPEGKAEGLTILITPKQAAPHKLGWLCAFNPLILFLTMLVGNYFAKGDTKLFQSIRFKLKRPIKEDYSVIQFIKHLEKHKTADWGFSSSSNGEQQLPMSAQAGADKIIPLLEKREQKMRPNPKQIQQA